MTSKLMKVALTKVPRRRRGTPSRVGEPPKVCLTPKARMTFRFQAAAGLTLTPIGNLDLVGMLGVATGATTVSSVIASVRIRSVRIYAPAAAGANANSEVLWIGNQQRVDERFNTATVGSAFAATVVSKPPPMSDCGKWIDGAVTSFTVFKVTLPIGAILDLDCDVRFHNQIVYYTPTGYTGSSGLTTGYMYFGPLDRQSSGALNAKLVPTGGVVYYG